MDSYVLKPGEVLNGGYNVQINDFTLRIIGGYEPRWENVYDAENSFTNWQGNAEKILKGKQFSLKLSTGQLSTEDYKALVQELKKNTINVSCPDFEGECYCESIPSSLTQANFLGARYKTDVTLISKDLLLNTGNGL